MMPQLLPPVPNSQAREDVFEKRRLRKNRKSRARHRKIAAAKKRAKAHMEAQAQWLQRMYGGAY